MFRACVNGYQEHLFDMQCLAVQQGFWAGYYQSKKPKPVNIIIEKLERERRKVLNKGKNIPKPEVDVSKYLEREARRLKYLASKKRM